MKLKLLEFFLQLIAKWYVGTLSKSVDTVETVLQVSPKLRIQLDDVTANSKIKAYKAAVQHESVFAFSRTAMGTEILETLDVEGEIGDVYVANLAMLLHDIHCDSKPDYENQNDREAVSKKILAKLFG